jgi:exodeoxyribonuclease VII large subunit
VATRVDREVAALNALAARPVLAAPGRLLTERSAADSGLRDRARRSLGAHLATAAASLDHARAQVRALSPAATLERGYAVLQQSGGGVLRSVHAAVLGDQVRARLADGELGLTVTGESGA